MLIAAAAGKVKWHLSNVSLIIPFIQLLFNGVLHYQPDHSQLSTQYTQNTSLSTTFNHIWKNPAKRGLSRYSNQSRLV